MGWELDDELPHTIQILYKHRRPLFFLVIFIVMPKSEVELVAEGDPVFVDEHNKPLQRPIIRINQLLRKCAHLCCSVPAVGAMDQHIIPLLNHSFYHHIRSLQYFRNHREITSVLKNRPIRNNRVKRIWLRNDLIHFPECFRNFMDIVDVAEDDVAVSVVLQILISAIFNILLSLRIQFWSGVIDYHSRIIHQPLRTISRLSQLNKHYFIFHLSVVHQPIHALTRPPHRAPRLMMIIAQRWQPIFCSEF